MNIVLELQDDFFTEEEKTILKKIFDCDDDDHEICFEKALKKVLIASLREYKEMFLGMGISTRAEDILQYRLFLLIEEFFEDKIPSESEISAMFQLTPTRSRSLIRSVTTKYKYQLQKKINDTLIKTLKNDINPKKDLNDNLKCKLYIPSDNALEQLNRLIEELAKDDPEIEKIRKLDGARIYTIYRGTFRKLCEKLGETINWDTELKD